MKQKCKFCKEKDFKQSAPNLSVDLALALKDRVIPSTGTQVEHNELETSDSVGIRVRDNFEAIEAQRAITAQGKAQAAADKAAKAAADKAAKAAADKAAKAAAESSTQQSAEGVN